MYARGGWVRSGSASVGFIGAALALCLARGPWQKGWLGWSEGWGLRRRDLTPHGRDEEKVDGAVGGRAAAEDKETLEEKVADEMAAEAVQGNERGESIGESRKS